MDYKELMEKSRGVMGTKLCKSCLVCDGKACRNTIPGPGAKGIGDVAMRNYDAWKNIRVNMDTITDNTPVSTELELFGKTFKYPIHKIPFADRRSNGIDIRFLIKNCTSNINAVMYEPIIKEFIEHTKKCIRSTSYY